MWKTKIDLLVPVVCLPDCSTHTLHRRVTSLVLTPIKLLLPEMLLISVHGCYRILLHCIFCWEMYRLPYSNFRHSLRNISWNLTFVTASWSSGQSYWLQNGDVLCFLWGTNWIYICYVEESRPPLWSNGQSSWLQIQRSGFDLRRYQIFGEVLSLERGPLSFLSTTEELLERKNSCFGLENRENGRGDPLRWPRDTFYSKNFTLTPPTSRACSVGIVGSRTKATEFNLNERKKIQLFTRCIPALYHRGL
jgi:hypothetical protein